MTARGVSSWFRSVRGPASNTTASAGACGPGRPHPEHGHDDSISPLAVKLVEQPLQVEDRTLPGHRWSAQRDVLRAPTPTAVTGYDGVAHGRRDGLGLRVLG